MICYVLLKEKTLDNLKKKNSKKIIFIFVSFSLIFRFIETLISSEEVMRKLINS